MDIREIIRAWEDPEYRDGLSADELAAMPGHPAGAIELTDAELGQVMGGGTRTRRGPGCQSGNSIGCNTKTCTRGNSANPCKKC